MSQFRIISGGQTGVDRAALDAAMEAGLPCGGWCPRGRKAEDGPIDLLYPLAETPSAKYAPRTRWNVRDSDATLVLTVGEPTGGTLLTVNHAVHLGRQHLVVDLDGDDDTSHAIVDWIRSLDLHSLNVAGPRESTSPGVYDRAKSLLRSVFARWSPAGDR